MFLTPSSRRFATASIMRSIPFSGTIRPAETTRRTPSGIYDRSSGVGVPTTPFPGPHT